MLSINMARGRERATEKRDRERDQMKGIRTRETHTQRHAFADRNTGRGETERENGRAGGLCGYGKEGREAAQSVCMGQGSLSERSSSGRSERGKEKR